MPGPTRGSGRRTALGGERSPQSQAIEEAPSGLKLRWSHDPQWDEWARLSGGVYILRTHIAEWTDEALWKTYVRLTEAETAFRIQKSALAIRPIWHHKAKRIKAHILVC